MEGAFTSTIPYADLAPVARDAVSNPWYDRAVRWSLYLIAVAAPLFFFSGVTPPTYVKQVFVITFALLAAVAYLAGGLVRGRIWYQRSLPNVIFFLLLLSWLVSGLLSGIVGDSLWGNDIVGERWLGFLAFGLALFLVQSLGDREAHLLLRVVTWSGGALMLISLVGLLFPSLIPMAGLGKDATLIGNAYSLAAVIGLYFILLLGLHFTGYTAGAPRWERIFVLAMLAGSFILLLLINHRSVWLALIAGLAVILSLIFRNAEGGIARAPIALIVGLIAVAGIFTLFSLKAPFLTLPAEIGPSYSGTLSIVGKTLKDYPVFGSGPGTFGLDYSRFRDVSVNQTPFWGIRFNTGAGFVPMLFATTGIAGGVLLLIFIGSVLYLLVRSHSFRRGGDGLLIAGGAAMIYGFLLWFIYVPTFAFQTVLFLLIGLVLLRIKHGGDTNVFWFSLEDRTLSFNAPTVAFLATMGSVFLMLGAVALIVVIGMRFSAAILFRAGDTAFAAGDLPRALEMLRRATELDTSNDGYVRTLSQAKLADLRNLVEKNQTAIGDFQTKFQRAAQDTIATAERAAVINPRDSQNWTNVGSVYQSLVPVIAGAEFLALKAYERAAELEPINPAISFNRAVVWALTADRVARVSPQNGTEFRNTLASAKDELKKAVALKPDYPEANFLLAQIAVRQGDLLSAITHVEELRKLAPFDIGLGLQLGILYYQAERLADAETELKRVLSYDARYANAQYFLGLTYDRTARRTEAIAEFEKVLASNPENQEVKTILANLRAGRSALYSIVSAPEKRTEPPVQ